MLADKQYTFKITITGIGETIDQAFSDACEKFAERTLDWGPGEASKEEVEKVEVLCPGCAAEYLHTRTTMECKECGALIEAKMGV